MYSLNIGWTANGLWISFEVVYHMDVKLLPWPSISCSQLPAKPTNDQSKIPRPTLRTVCEVNNGEMSNYLLPPSPAKYSSRQKNSSIRHISDISAMLARDGLWVSLPVVNIKNFLFTILKLIMWTDWFRRDPMISMCILSNIISIAYSSSNGHSFGRSFLFKWSFNQNAGVF